MNAQCMFLVVVILGGCAALSAEQKPCECPNTITDLDRDGVQDRFDNCVSIRNPKQRDLDHDYIGDECDHDDDNDDFEDDVDNCPLVSNKEQKDADHDGVGDVCDNCVNVVNFDQQDADSDAAGNACDQCIDVPEDRDGYHDDDGCPDPDNDHDLVQDVYDACPLTYGEGESGCPIDE